MYLPRRQLTSRRRYGNSRASAASTAGGENVSFTRCPSSRLVQCSAPTCLDRCPTCWPSAQYVVPYIRSTKRHSHICFYVEPTDSSAACYKVIRHYAGDGSLRFKRRSPQPGHGSLRFERRSAGDGSPRSESRPVQLRHYSGDGSLRLGRSSSQPRQGPRAPSAPPSRHAPRSGQTAAPAGRCFQRGCPTSPPSRHAVAVGLWCGKANTETPRSRVQLHSAFPRSSGGRSTIFPFKEESTRIATSPPFPSRPTGLSLIHI